MANGKIKYALHKNNLTVRSAGGSRVTRYDLDMFFSEREKKYLLLYFLFMTQVMCIWSSFSHRSMKANFLFIEMEGKLVLMKLTILLKTHLNYTTFRRNFRKGHCSMFNKFQPFIYF